MCMSMCVSSFLMDLWKKISRGLLKLPFKTCGCTTCLCVCVQCRSVCMHTLVNVSSATNHNTILFSILLIASGSPIRWKLLFFCHLCVFPWVSVHQTSHSAFVHVLILTLNTQSRDVCAERWPVWPHSVMKPSGASPTCMPLKTPWVCMRYCVLQLYTMGVLGSLS